MRWKPTRAGIFNVWEYDDHVFEFGDGRLVLRGRNGSGKSNALALLFPFLLDGVMSAARMDPMGGSRSMKSLLLGRDDDDRTGRYRHDSGTGYVWMEFHDGAEHATIGIGASATSQRDADAWFFVTGDRVGVDLELADGDVPLGRRQLAERLEDGATFDTADAFRVAVDRKLFGLGPSRYRSLVDLLLTLRRPHLAGKLDTDHLSATLSTGLAELDPDLIDDVAHSFDDLDAMQHELEGLASSLDAVERFLPIYREHLVGTGRTRAQGVVSAHEQLRRLEKEHATAESERAAIDASAEGLRTRLSDVATARTDVDAEIDDIQQSPAYQSATALAEVLQAAQRAAEAAEVAAGRAESSAAETERTTAEVRQARLTLEDAAAEVDAAVDAWLGTAASTGVEAPFGPDEFDAELATAAVVERRAQLDQVAALARSAADAVWRAEHAEAEQSRRADAVDEAAAASDDAATEVDRVRADLAERRSPWRARLDELVARLDALSEALSSGSDPLAAAGGDGHAPAHAPDAEDPDIAAFRTADRFVGDLGGLAARALDVAAGHAERQRSSVEELSAERERVATEPNPGPATNPTRPDAAREDRAGVPLYVCVDFADHVDEAARAGIEAALGAAGLLDARISSDGTGDDALDAWIVEPRAHSDQRRSLAEVLVPVPVDSLDTDRIAEVLRSVPLDDEVVELHPDGRWRLGPLAGRYSQPESHYIGHAARERRRARRLAELDEQLTVEHTELARLEDRQAALVSLHRDLTELRREQPSVGPLSSAIDDLARRRAVLEERRAELERARAAAEEQLRRADAATSALHRAARVARLPVGEEELAAIREALRECDRCRDNVLARRDARTIAQRSFDHSTDSHERATSRARDDAVAAERAAADARREAQRYERLRDDIGGDAELAVERLAAAKRHRDEIERLREGLADELSDAERQIARLSERAQQLDVRRRDAVDAADAAERRFAVVCSAELADVLAVDGVEPGAEPRHAARSLLAGTEPPPEDATNRMEKAHREILLDGLRAGHDPSMPKVDGVDVVRVGTADGELPIGTLANQLRSEHERTSQLLSKQEREIFETHLLTRVGDSLRQLLLEADEFEHRINDEMAKAPTESGMVVELRWEVATDEPGLRDAVQTLRTAPEMLGPERREALREFFMGRIADLRSSDPGRSFAETLTGALDYRSWHQFALFARFADGKRQRVTRAFYKGLSGGEAATLLHLPLFAAAASQYSSGSIDGPRLIALDEAFAGIDEQMRSRLMGLLSQLDLDVLLTSHEFWGFYDTVSSLVLYDLVRRPPNPGVFAQRFDWSTDDELEVGGVDR